ncbi:Lpg1974 family pore-forming outer membrane protein [Legionella sp. W05-934-2]|uniref:Lpg1974 family pore-forming outer membrane protein n=1 Tax=Legionella sp. W05-934-2 TaxID=1198649 RepID=UPI003462851C
MKKGFLCLLLIVSSQIFAIQHSHQIPSFFAELLMWQVREVSDDNWGQLLGPVGTYQQNQFLSIPFAFSPGLRVGFGLHNEERPCNILVYYTGYQTRGKNHVATNNGEVHSAYLGNFFAQNLNGAGLSGPYYKQAGINWQVQLHSLDLELGRSIIIDNLVNLRPYVGLKGSAIRQSLKTNWQRPFNNTTKMPITTFSYANENITNNFKGIGPSVGLKSTWYLVQAPKQALNLRGDFSGAFLWGRWTITDVYQNNTPVSITIQNDKMSTGAPMARGYLGLEWANAFNHANLTIRIGYEGQVWFNQLRYYSFDMGRTNDSLFFHGGVFDVSLHV